MNKLFLIGNGFDLAHGLKTRYTDFIVWYLNKVLTKLRETPEHNDGLIRIYRQGYTGPINYVPTIQSFNYEIKRNALTIEYKHPFIQKLINSAQEYNWVDIESEYYAELIRLYQNMEAKNTTDVSLVIERLKALNICFDFIKKELVEYLHEIENTPKSINEEIYMHIQKEIKKAVGSTMLNESRILF
jgi:abortive infection AbiH-like protein